MQVWGWLILLFMIVGTFAGLYAARQTTERLMGSRWSRSINRPPSASRTVAWAVGAVAAPFVWFLSIVVGGSLGGGYGDALAKEVGVSLALIVPLGIGLGICLIMWIGVAAASCTAFVIARSLERIGSNNAV